MFIGAAPGFPSQQGNVLGDDGPVTGSNPALRRHRDAPHRASKREQPVLPAQRQSSGPVWRRPHRQPAAEGAVAGSNPGRTQEPKPEQLRAERKIGLERQVCLF